ncbi:hypothetical protein PHMEG_000623 [Phytophthora megakarya]|uniref:Uncharacterized protein n=1 Tax=Phytophthora megakarya TaxID=4795 RepID=A0A225X359_9STRA|nr:hypothetical protein PHMEG_000623 [Phytophthora megakarya]
MDVEMMARRVFTPRFPPFAPFSLDMLPKLHHEDTEFFKDLPIKRPEEAEKETLEAAAPKYSASSPSEKEGPEAVLEKEEPSAGADGTVPHPSYTSYSYTYSTMLDHSGHRIGTVRRRYEDSTGRLKATHEREIGDKKLKMVWSRSNTQDEGGHETTCSSGNPDDFEKEWLETPFGRAEDEELVKWMEDRERRVHQAFGIEYEPDKSMPKFSHTETAVVKWMEDRERRVHQAFGIEYEPDKSMPKFSHTETAAEEQKLEEGDRERQETIQKMAKRQEEETTPPQFS